MALESLPDDGYCYTNLPLWEKENCDPANGIVLVTLDTLSQMITYILDEWPDEPTASFLLDLSYVSLDSPEIMAQIEFFLMLADLVKADVVLVCIPLQEDYLEGMVAVNKGKTDKRTDISWKDIDYDLWPVFYFDLAVNECQKVVLRDGVLALVEAIDKGLDHRDSCPFTLPIENRIKRSPKAPEEVAPSVEIEERRVKKRRKIVKEPAPNVE